MRLIDAEHLKWNVGGIKCGTLTVAYLDWILEHEEPTVDAVPVIRCKDCKHWQFYDSVKANVCKRRYDRHYWQSHEDDFCSRAERKEE